MGLFQNVQELVAPEKIVSSDKPLTQTREVKLQATTDGADTISKPQSVKDQYGIPRINRIELETLFIGDGIVFNSIVKMKDLIMSAKTGTDKPYFFEGSEESVAFFENFYDSIGDTGGDVDDLELFERVWLDQMIYGVQFTENIRSKQSKKIVDLDYIDPKSMTPALDSQGKIIVDAQNRVVGFVQELPTDVDITNLRKAEPPANLNLSLTSNQLYFPTENVTYHKYLAVGDGLVGVGLVEPIYNIAKYKFNVEDAYAQSWLRVGQPIPVGYVGSESREPTEENMQQTLEQLQDLNNKSALALPYYNKVELLEPKRRFGLRDDLNHFVDNTVTGMGIPNTFALGRGEINNKTSGDLKHFMEVSLINFVRKTLRRIERQQINLIAKDHGIEPVKIRWGEFSLKELDSKANRLMLYAQTGLLTPYPELEEHIKTIEGLPKKTK